MKFMYSMCVFAKMAAMSTLYTGYRTFQRKKIFITASLPLFPNYYDTQIIHVPFINKYLLLIYSLLDLNTF